MPSTDLIQAIAVTAELCGRVFSPEAARIFVQDLDGFSEQSIVAALRRCRREVRGVLTVQDVVSRIDDGRPGPDEAWAMLPMDEATSALWTDEMADAFGVALPLLYLGDKVGARMAFKEAYTTRINAARDAKRTPNWTVTLGHDPRGREVVLRQAVGTNRLTMDQARSYMPMLDVQMPKDSPLLTDRSTAQGGHDMSPDSQPNGAPPMPCKQCGSMTSRSVLSFHGGMCYPCYCDYQRGGPSAVPNALKTYTRMEDSVTVADMKKRLKS